MSSPACCPSLPHTEAVTPKPWLTWAMRFSSATGNVRCNSISYTGVSRPSYRSSKLLRNFTSTAIGHACAAIKEELPLHPCSHRLMRDGPSLDVRHVPTRKLTDIYLGPACGQCTARDGTCAYDMTDEQRKLTYLRDHSEQLQRKLNALEALLHALQNGPDEEAHELFRRLKDGESPYLLADYAQSGGLQSDASQQGPPSTSSFTRACCDPASYPQIGALTIVRIC